MMLTLPALTWHSSPNYSSRLGNKVTLIVLHDCEGLYNGSIDWLTNPKTEVSAHIILSQDGKQATQLVSWNNKAWHVKAFNSISEGIEAVGFSKIGLGAAEWNALALITAYRLKKNNLPCQVANLQNKWVGFCQHIDLGAAGGGHHDITSDQKIWISFVEVVKAYYNNVNLPRSWTNEHSN